MPKVFDSELGATWQVPQVTSGHAGNPGSTDDAAHGHSVGDIWINTSNAVYMCAVATTGAATWVLLG